MLVYKLTCLVTSRGSRTMADRPRLEPETKYASHPITKYIHKSTAMALKIALLE